jgi:AraC-like DNA-binding protein
VLNFELGEPIVINPEGRASFSSASMAVIGPMAHTRASVSLFGTIDSFAIFFQPGGFAELFGVPLGKLVDRAHEAADVMGTPARQLWNQLGEATGFAARVALTERFLLGCLSEVRPSSWAISTANRFLAHPGQPRIVELARSVGISVRQFERRFLLETGVTPKLFARIARFQCALDAKVGNPGCPWLKIAHAMGYFDQMHMVHDFRKLGGDSPQRLLESLGDMRPEALADN